MLSTRLDNFLPFPSNLKLSYANSFSLEESKICRLVMGLSRDYVVKSQTPFIRAYLKYMCSFTYRTFIPIGYPSLESWHFQTIPNFHNKIFKDSCWRVDWLYGVLHCCIQVISQGQSQLILFMSFLSVISTRLLLLSVLPKDISSKNPEDSVWFKPRAPGL